MKAGWQQRQIGEICEVVNGGTPKTGIAAYWGGPHQWITPAEMGKRNSPYINETERTLTDTGLANSSARLLPPYSVILSSRAPIGYLVINTEPMATNQGCKGLIPSRLIDHKFLYYYLSSISDLLNDLGTGATFRELSGGKLKEVTVPFPSLPEQQRIVAILDEAFAAIATAKANAEKNLKNAQDLLKGHLNDLFCHREVEWVEKRLGDISRISYGFTESASFEKIGPQFLRITDISDSGVDWGTVPYCPIDASVLSKYRLVEGDIVFARTGATTGKSYLVSNPPESVFASYLIRVQLRDKELMPQFLNLFFQTKQYWDTIYAGVSGSAQGGFNAKKLGDLLIPFPKSSKEQMTIVAQFDKLTAEVQRFARLYERKLSSLEMLKKSLLHRAFNGQLTAQVTDRAFAEAAL